MRKKFTTPLRTYQWLVAELQKLSDDLGADWHGFPCLEWPFAVSGRKGKPAYGVTYADGRCVPAHVAAWEIVHGKTENNIYLRHYCGNGLCFRPVHLFTRLRLNTKEMLGRARRQSATAFRQRNLAKVRQKERDRYHSDSSVRQRYSENSKRRRVADPEKARAKDKERRERRLATDPEAVRLYNIRYQQEHRDKVLELRQRRRDKLSADPKYREQYFKIQRDWKEKNRDILSQKQKEYFKRYYASHKEEIKQRARNHRAHKRSAQGCHTPADVRNLYRLQGGKCGTCKRVVARTGNNKFHVDHVMPLCKGGSNGPENLQLLCKKCNLRKNAKDPDDWAHDNGLLFC